MVPGHLQRVVGPIVTAVLGVLHHSDGHGSAGAGRRLTGNALGNLVLQTEARVTLIDAGLAAAVLVGIALNTALGWWWADPLAGLVIVFYVAREGYAAWVGE